jgi:hypothetical protein
MSKSIYQPLLYLYQFSIYKMLQTCRQMAKVEKKEVATTIQTVGDDRPEKTES